MIYEKENVYENLIEDYKNSINSLKARLNRATDIDDIRKIAKLIEGYEDQLSKLRQSIN